MRLWMTTEVMKVYIRLHKRRKTEQDELLQTVSTALISKILLTLQFLFNWKWGQLEIIKSASNSKATCVHTVSQSLFLYCLAQPDSHLTRSLTQVKEKGGCVSCYMGFHFFSLHHIYGLPDASFHCKWRIFIWSTQVMEAIRQSPLSYKYLWPPREYIIQMQAGAHMQLL